MIKGEIFMSTPLTGLGSSGTTIKKYATIPGAKENIINTSAYPSANVWCDVVKTYDNNKRQGSFDDFIRGRVDPNKGAYYSMPTVMRVRHTSTPWAAFLFRKRLPWSKQVLRARSAEPTFPWVLLPMDQPIHSVT